MKPFEAEVVCIENEGSLNIVTFHFCGRHLSMMSLDLGSHIGVGSRVVLNVKPSHIALGKGECENISYSNKLSCKIESLVTGKLLCVVKLRCCGVALESIITRSSARRLDLQEGEHVTAYIKASDLSIKEVQDD